MGAREAARRRRVRVSGPSRDRKKKRDSDAFELSYAEDMGRKRSR